MTRVRTHPGEILNEEYLVPLDLSGRQLAEAIGVPSNQISDGSHRTAPRRVVPLTKFF